MAAVRHLGIILPPYETTHEVCCWSRLPVKFHVNLIHRSEDIAIWIFRIFGLKSFFITPDGSICLFGPPKWGFWGLWTPKCDYSSSRPAKGTSWRKSASFKLSTVKNPLRGLTCRRVDRKCNGHTDTQVNLYSVHALHSIGQTIIDWLFVMARVHLVSGALWIWLLYCTVAYVVTAARLRSCQAAGVCEVMRSESSFIAAMSVGLETFSRPARHAALLSPDQHRQLFQNVDKASVATWSVPQWTRLCCDFSTISMR